MNDNKSESLIPNENVINKNDLSWYQRTFSHISNDSLRGSIFILIMTALGTGVFGLHHCFGLIGIYSTCILILMFGIFYLILYRMIYFIRKIDNLKAKSISEGITNVAGNKIGVIYNIFVLLYLYLCVIPLVQSISKCIFTNFYNLIIRYLDIESLEINKQEKYFNKIFVFCISPLLFFINYQQNIEKFKIFSIPSFVVFVYIFILIISQSSFYYKELIEEKKDEFNYWSTNFKDFMLNYSIVLFSYNCSINYYSIFSVVRNPTSRRIKKISFRTIIVLILIFILYGVTSYYSLGNSFRNVSLFIFRPALKNSSDILMIIGRSLLSISLIIAVGLNTYPLKMNTLSLLKLEWSKTNNLVITIIYTISIVLISAFCTDIKFFISIAGSLTGTVTAFSIPGLVALYYGYNKERKHYYFLWFVILLITFIGILSTIMIYINFKN